MILKPSHDFRIKEVNTTERNLVLIDRLQEKHEVLSEQLFVDRTPRDGSAAFAEKRVRVVHTEKEQYEDDPLYDNCLLLYEK